MSTGEGHPIGTPPLGVLVIALSFAVLVVLGVVSHGSAPGSGVDVRAARALVTEARDAMTAAGAVSAIGGGTTHVAGIGEVTVTERDYAATTSGSQMVTMTSGDTDPGMLPAATTLDVSGTVDVEADASFWSKSIGVGDVQATEIAGRWVQVPRSSSIYVPTAADLTIPSLMQDLFHARTYHEGTIRTVDGVRAIAVTYRNGGNDSGPVTCYLAAGGSHLPVMVTIGGLTLHLSGWGKVRALTAPAGVIPLPSLAEPTNSGAPVAA